MNFLSLSFTFLELVLPFAISYRSMEDGHDGSNSKGMCEKFFCCLCPNFLPSHDAHHKLAARSGAEAARNEMVRMPKGEMVRPIKVYGERQQHVIVRLNSEDETDDKKPGLAKNDTFSDYINRTKVKIRASKSNVGIEKDASREGHAYKQEKDNDGKDAFSDFVNRAKIKIQKTSSIGSSRNISFQN